MGVVARGRAEGDRYVAEWAFTDRRGGVSAGAYASLNVGGKVDDDPAAVERNRSIVASYVGADALTCVHQVHGRDVATFDRVPGVSAGEPDRRGLGAPPGHPGLPQADAAVTDTPGLALAIQTADCVPLLLADPTGGRVAAVHAGWRGVAADVVGAALDALAPVGPVQAWVGPAICPGCYEVSEQVRDEVAAAAPAAAATTRAGTPAVDIRAGVLAQLAARGIVGTLVGGCTFESPDLFSFRRDAVTGRQAGVIVLRRAHG